MAVPSVSPLRRWPLMAAALLLCAAGLAHAQSADDSGNDPPDRVARLAYLSGDIGLLPAGAQDWGEAGVNRPLTRGDKLSSGADARAELELDGSTLRVDRQTDFGFLELSDQLAQVELTRGTLHLAVRRLDDGQSYEIDTPTVALVVDQPGSYRVDVDADGGGTRITAFDGSATVYGENDAQRRVVAGRSYRFDDSALAQVELSDIRGGDAFDAWCSDRDQRYASSETRRYVSEDVVGYTDLDRYGDWRSDADYGPVWYPSQVGSDWAPYRDGHWAWIAPWGWTWVDDSPWGFAPYHYGRWAYVRGAWGWVPGPVAIRPVYAPALVAFAGGSGWNVSLNLGGSAPIGWFPLGPGEVYNPWYRSSRVYYTQINVTNIRMRQHHRRAFMDRLDQQYGRYRRGLPVRGVHYANRDAPRGFTAVPARSFAGARHVQRDLLQVDPRRRASAPLLGRASAPAPTRGSFAPPRGNRSRALPAGGFERAVVARRAPPAPFATQRLAREDGQALPHRPPALRSPANVRVLTPRRDAVPDAVADPSTRYLPTVPVLVRGTPTRSTPADTAAPAANGELRRARNDELRPGELRSARFARPRNDAPASRLPERRPTQSMPDAVERPPRPGVSYISSPTADHQRDVRATPSARQDRPQVPRLERAPADTDRRDARRMSAVRASRPPVEGAAPMPRFERAHSLRAPDFNAPPREALPQRVDRPPPGYRPPRGDGPPRPMPQSAPPVQRAPQAAAPATPSEPAARPGRTDREPRRHDRQH